MTELCCAECGRLERGLALGWRAYLAGGAGEETTEAIATEAIVFCPECAMREFDLSEPTPPSGSTPSS